MPGGISEDAVGGMDTIKPGETQTACVFAINMPPLEDLYGIPYWKDRLEMMPLEGEEFIFRADIQTWAAEIDYEDSRDYKEKTITVECKIRIKPRSEKEMALLKKWYDDTPEELFPILNNEKNARDRYAYTGIYEEPTEHPSYKVPALWEKCITDVMGPPLPAFIRLGNRYPSYPFSKNWEN